MGWKSLVLLWWLPSDMSSKVKQALFKQMVSKSFTALRLRETAYLTATCWESNCAMKEMYSIHLPASVEFKRLVCWGVKIHLVKKQLLKDIAEVMETNKSFLLSQWIFILRPEDLKSIFNKPRNLCDKVCVTDSTACGQCATRSSRLLFLEIPRRQSAHHRNYFMQVAEVWLHPKFCK